jgi:hypothetical protein
MPTAFIGQSRSGGYEGGYFGSGEAVRVEGWIEVDRFGTLDEFFQDSEASRTRGFS